MPEQKEHYARYVIVRGHQALWKGDPSEKGAQFRQVVITSDEWMLTTGAFQVYALEGRGSGIVDHKLSVEPNPKVLFDADFNGLEAASKKSGDLVKEAEALGFRVITFIEEMEFQAKLRL